MLVRIPCRGYPYHTEDSPLITLMVNPNYVASILESKVDSNGNPVTGCWITMCYEQGSDEVTGMYTRLSLKSIVDILESCPGTKENF